MEQKDKPDEKPSYGVPVGPQEQALLMGDRSSSWGQNCTKVDVTDLRNLLATLSLRYSWRPTTLTKATCLFC